MPIGFGGIMNDSSNSNREGGVYVSAAQALVKALANTAVSPIQFRISSAERDQKKEDRGQQQVTLLRELSAAGIDPQLFDLMLSNELDRNLKRQFGWGFLAATIFFTILSYGVIVLNSVYAWKISEFAINSLIIETPIQFIGLLYIIARNLFPQTGSTHNAPPLRRGKSRPKPDARAPSPPRQVE
jgi:hypothetical protein